MFRRLLLFSCFLGLALVTMARAEVTDVTHPLLPVASGSTKVYDRQGRFVGRILPEGRYWVPLERIPLFLRDALVAVEDARFYEHGGLDMRGIARALVKDVTQGKLAEGGSTITQQLVKNKHLSAEKTLDRKVKEGFIAMDYESRYTKEQILEMYFNEIYYGNGAWGLAQAARLYFDKNPEELSEAECAILAGVPKNPSRYNPFGKPEEVTRRQRIVLARMSSVGFITPEREAQIAAMPWQPAPASRAEQYLAHIRRKLIDSYGALVVEAGGLEIVAAIDLRLQLLAEETLASEVRKVSPDLQGALVCIDPQTGDLLASAGAVDSRESAYNRALYAKRQPGSAIKPLIYLDALEHGITAASRWDDTPVAYKGGKGQRWTPRNYGGESFGSLTLREALAHSGNVVTVKLLDTVGVGDFVAFAGRLGLPLRTPANLALALGADEVTPHDLVLAYAPFANGGKRAASRAIVSIFDVRSNAWREEVPQLTEVVSPESAYIATRMLQDVLTVGTARNLRAFAAERPLAGKTGTTDDGRDAWFVGYTPQLLAGVWVGHDTPRPGGKGFTGGAIAAPVWERFMRRALADIPAADFPQPEMVVSAEIDPQSGQLASPDCPESRVEYFRAWSEPTVPCPLHGGAATAGSAATP